LIVIAAVLSLTLTAPARVIRKSDDALARQALAAISSGSVQAMMQIGPPEMQSWIMESGPEVSQQLFAQSAAKLNGQLGQVKRVKLMSDLESENNPGGREKRWLVTGTKGTVDLELEINKDGKIARLEFPGLF
jgi:hypothetical protein